MAEYERRNHGSRGNYVNRKRRFRDDDDFDRRPQRRRQEEPLSFKIKRQFLTLAESPLKKVEDEISAISKMIVQSPNDEDLQSNVINLAIKLTTEQPMKIPFIAALFTFTNSQSPKFVQESLERTVASLQENLEKGSWREVKLQLRFLACIQGLLEGDGVFPVLEDLFSRAVDLQTASSEDGLGLELVKIILFTIAYLMASAATGFDERAVALLEKTEIIASTPHSLEALVDPYPGNEELNAHGPQSIISILQRQLQGESVSGWMLKCIPRPWKTPELEESLKDAPKHTLPAIIVPSPVNPGNRPRLPEIYVSMYTDQEFETVPSEDDIASSVVRDSLVDMINILDFNRVSTARFLIDVDCYFAPATFVKRATPFDKLRELSGDLSTWKPEDVAVDAVFSQLFQLPTPEHKLVYFHSVLTEACKIAPAAIAPSLGRAIRYLYKNLRSMDLELQCRFMDWFAHHLSNFGFTWKWTEWADEVELPISHPQKAFIVGALEKEIRLSVVRRIQGTLPEQYQPLLPESDEEDVPRFKYADDKIPYAIQAREILRLIKSKAPDADVQVQINSIQDSALEQGVVDPLIPSTDVYMTSICFAGAKSLSHILSYIERCKDRLLAIAPSSGAAQRQIINSVLEYWAEKPGVGVNIVDKLLNYTILTPLSVIEWALIDKLDSGKILTRAHTYEMIASTVYKVTNRVRQIVRARNQKGLPAEQVALLDGTLAKERAQMEDLFAVLEDGLRGVAEGSADAMIESQDQDEEREALNCWGRKWLRVFRRKMAVEQAWMVQEMLTDTNGE